MKNSNAEFNKACMIGTLQGIVDTTREITGYEKVSDLRGRLLAILNGVRSILIIMRLNEEGKKFDANSWFETMINEQTEEQALAKLSESMNATIDEINLICHK